MREHLHVTTIETSKTGPNIGRRAGRSPLLNGRPITIDSSLIPFIENLANDHALNNFPWDTERDPDFDLLSDLQLLDLKWDMVWPTIQALLPNAIEMKLPLDQLYEEIHQVWQKRMLEWLKARDLLPTQLLARAA